MGNVSILQVKISYPITSHDFNVQISTVVPSQIATGYFWLLVSVSASMKTCIYQETQTQKLEQTFFLSFCPSAGQWKEWDLLLFLHCLFSERPSKEAISHEELAEEGLALVSEKTTPRSSLCA